MNRNRQSVFWGAAFLMATSAIGPGFLTQTTVFTQQLTASFGFVILVSILLDIGVQLNIWRIITAANKPAQEIAEGLLPGMGKLLSLLIVAGGLAFNTGNIAGAGLGLEVVTGMDNRMGAVISALLAILLLSGKNALLAMDWFVKILGLLMIGLTLYVAVASGPPLGEALYRSFLPQQVSFTAIITVVGGTVGGYICFAGAHRLLLNNQGAAFIPQEVNKAAISGILTASLMRVLLFLAALGVVSVSLSLNKTNPAADVFRKAAGETGFRLFGIVMWSAAITSVVGSAFTSISFLLNWHPAFRKRQPLLVASFIGISAITFLFAGNPVKILVWAGTINGFILPVALAILLLAAQKLKTNTGYHHPKWLGMTGWLISLLLAAMAVKVLLT